MPNDDLGYAFTALSDDAAHARLAPAVALRKRAARQTLTRSLGGVAAAAVLVTAAAVLGSRLTLADDALPPLPPAASTAPTVAPPSVAPSSSPSVSSSSSDPSPAGPTTPATSKPSEPAMPGSIPARAFLTRSDANVMTLTRLAKGRSGPRLCDEAGYPSTQLVGIRGSVQIVYRRPGQGEEYTASGYVTDTITVFRSDGAEQFLEEFRAAVRDCPRGDRGEVTFSYRTLGSLGTGDESLLVQGSTPARGDDGELSNDGSKYVVYLAAVRVGDSVALVETDGYEAVSAERGDAERFARKAAQRLADWRS